MIHRRPFVLSSARRSTPLCFPRPALALAALLFASIAGAAVRVTSLAPDIDTFVQERGPAARLDGDNLKASAAGVAGNGRKIFLKFTVTEATTNGGKPREGYPAVLKLYKSSDAAAPGSEIMVSAANNDWPQTLTWASAMRQTTPLASTSAAVGPGVISFDVTPYISGPGTYTFCVTANTHGAVVFDSTETQPGTETDPVLEISSESDPTSGGFAAQISYFTRPVLEVLADGERYRDRYRASNPGAGNDIDQVGCFDATKQPYGLSVTGNPTANRYALQRAINEARDARVAVYIPPGTYEVDDQIQMIQGIVPQPSAPYTAATFTERWDLNDFPCVLLGNPTGGRTQLRIAASSTAFPDAPATPRPLLNAWSRFNSGGEDPKTNKAASHFNQVIANVDLDLGGHPGAIGIDIGGSQGTSVRDLTVNAAGAFAGMRGMPGAGGLTENFTVVGGRYGIYCTDPVGAVVPHLAYTPTVIGSTFTGQTENAIRYDGAQGLVLVGCSFDFSEASAAKAPLRLGGTTPVRGSIALVDSRVVRAHAGPLVNGTRSAYLRDVYAFNTDPVARLEANAGSAPAPVAGRTDGWLHIQEYYDGVRIAPFPNVPAQYMPTRIDGTLMPPNGGSLLAIAPEKVPTDLQSRHRAPALPHWSDTSQVVNVKSLGATAPVGDGIAADGAKIQAALNAAVAAGKALFIPRGDYLLEQTLHVPNDAVVFGIDKSLTRLRPQRGLFAGSGAYQPLVVAGEGTEADRHARTLLADFALMKRQDEPLCYLLEWTIGRDAVVRNMIFERRNVGSAFSMAHSLVRLSGANAGGRWFNFWNDSDAAQSAGAYHHLEVTGTREPLRFYMLNAETDTNTVTVQINNAKYVDVFQTKWEAASRNSAPILEINSSTDVRFFGFGGNAFMRADGALNPDDDSAIKLNGCDDLLLATQVFQASFANNSPLNSHEFFWVKDDAVTLPRKEQFVLYRVGQPANNVWPASNGALDGWVQTTAIDANASDATALRIGDDATNASYRSIVSFDTSALPANAIPVSAKLTLRVGAINGSPAALGNLQADLATGHVGANTGLAADDFASPVSASHVIDGAITATTGQWQSFSLSAAGLAAINRSGLTQIRLSSVSATNGDGSADFVGFHSGDASDPKNRPTLEIIYRLP